MSETDSLKVPDDVLVPVLQEMQRERGHCVDNFVTYDIELLRHKCGERYAGIPADDIRRQGINLRKRGVLGSVNGHGPTKLEGPSKEYKEYLASPHWKQFAQHIKEWWDWRCALCYCVDECLSVHHRTYDRLGHESMNDVVALCRKCHKVADVRRQRQSQRGDEGKLF